MVNEKSVKVIKRKREKRESERKKEREMAGWVLLLATRRASLSPSTSVVDFLAFFKSFTFFFIVNANPSESQLSWIACV